jgi:uncharacterized cysteine cluster protein YcgN (CxxCxxCC family)
MTQDRVKASSNYLAIEALVPELTQARLKIETAGLHLFNRDIVRKQTHSVYTENWIRGRTVKEQEVSDYRDFLARSFQDWQQYCYSAINAWNLYTTPGPTDSHPVNSVVKDETS